MEHKKYLTTKEAAAYLGLTEKGVRNMVQARAVKFYRLSPSSRGKIRFLAADLDAAMAANAVETVEPMTPATEERLISELLR